MIIVELTLNGRLLFLVLQVHGICNRCEAEVRESRGPVRFVLYLGDTLDMTHQYVSLLI